MVGEDFVATVPEFTEIRVLDLYFLDFLKVLTQRKQVYFIVNGIGNAFEERSLIEQKQLSPFMFCSLVVKLFRVNRCQGYRIHLQRSLLIHIEHMQLIPVNKRNPSLIDPLDLLCQPQQISTLYHSHIFTHLHLKQ